MEIRRSSEQSKPGFSQVLLLLNEVSRLDEALTPLTTEGFFFRLTWSLVWYPKCVWAEHTHTKSASRKGKTRLVQAAYLSSLPVCVCVCLRVVLLVNRRSEVSQGRANAAKSTKTPLRKSACRRQGVGSFRDDMTERDLLRPRG